MFKYIFTMVFIFCGAVNALGQEMLVDRLAATVNGDPITQSDLIWNIALDPAVPENSKQATYLIPILNQIIDQRLLLAEAIRLPSLDPSTAELTQAISELIARFPSATIFYQRLSAVGLTREMLMEILRQRLRILKYIDFRFRSFIVVTETELQQYYQQVYIPQLQQRNIKPNSQPTEEERALIEAILVEERVNRETERFLENTRQQADIVILLNENEEKEP